MTPTPWHLHPGDASAIVGNDLAVARVFDADDAVQIVRCVNAHDEMVEALLSARNVLFVYAIGAGESQASESALAKMDAALAKAKAAS